MIDTFGNEICVGDTVLYPYSNDYTEPAYEYSPVVKVNEKSVVVEYKTPKRQLKRVLRLSTRGLLIKLTHEQVEDLNQQKVFDKLSRGK